MNISHHNKHLTRLFSFGEISAKKKMTPFLNLTATTPYLIRQRNQKEHQTEVHLELQDHRERQGHQKQRQSGDFQVGIFL